MRPQRTIRWWIPGMGFAFLAVAAGLSKLGAVGAYIGLAICIGLGGYLIFAMASRWNRRS